MASFKQAMLWLREGKYVKRPCWEGDSYWKLGKHQLIFWKDGIGANIHLNQIEANDWEIYQKPHTPLGDKTYCGGHKIDTKDVKETVQNMLRRINKILIIYDGVGYGCNNEKEREMFRVGYKNGRDVLKTNIIEIIFQEFGEKLT